MTGEGAGAGGRAEVKSPDWKGYQLAGELNSGNSEIRNWIAAAGAAEHLTARALDYVPCYRSPAGTGCGMGFVAWE